MTTPKRKAGQPRGGRRARRERGAYGNSRGTTEQRRQRARQENARVQGGLAEAREAEHALDLRMRAEAEETARLEALGIIPTDAVVRRQQELQAVAVEAATVIEAPQRRATTTPFAQMDAEAARLARENWDLATARLMVRQGYTIEHVVRRTGWPEEMVADAADIAGLAPIYRPGTYTREQWLAGEGISWHAP